MTSFDEIINEKVVEMLAAGKKAIGANVLNEADEKVAFDFKAGKFPFPKKPQAKKEHPKYDAPLKKEKSDLQYDYSNTGPLAGQPDEPWDIDEGWRPKEEHPEKSKPNFTPPGHRTRSGNQILIPENDFYIEDGFVSREKFAEILKSHYDDPAAVQFLASCL